MFFSNKNLFKVFILVLLNQQVCADDQHIFFDQPASAKELGKILFSPDNPGVNSAAIKTRSISFIKKGQTSTTPTISVGMPIKFAFNSAELLSNAKPYLDEIGKMLNFAEYKSQKMLIEGHTDASGSKQYNQLLSERRARTIKGYLVSHFQIASQRLLVIGLGEDKPMPGSNPHDGINRRVQFYKAN